MTDLSNFSLEQLQERLGQLDAEWYEVQHEIDERRDREKHDLVEEILQKIAQSDYGVVDVVAHLRGGRRRSRLRGGGAARDRSYIVYADPDNPSNTYSRGPLPTWLKDKMKTVGMDPADKMQREMFKQKHLKRG